MSVTAGFPTVKLAKDGRPTVTISKSDKAPDTTMIGELKLGDGATVQSGDTVTLQYQGVNFRTGPSTSHPVLRLLPKATAVVHVPGRITSGFIPVTIGTQTGWISSSYVSPTKPAVAAPAVVKPATYKTTAALNLRTGTSTTAPRLLVIPKGATVGAIQASSGVWRKVSYAGKTGWVHSAYLAKR